jgi:hypothetical protein
MNKTRVEVNSELTQEQKQWLDADECLWRRAVEIAGRSKGLDATGIYHVLRNLGLSPSERLRKGLVHGRLRPKRG